MKMPLLISKGSFNEQLLWLDEYAEIVFIWCGTVALKQLYNAVYCWCIEDRYFTVTGKIKLGKHLVYQYECYLSRFSSCI